jgi:VanZ family protein
MNKKVIKWMMVVVWLILIFGFSSQPGDISNGNNRFIISIFKTCGLNLDSILGNFANFIVRKAGHLTEYFILCILLMNALQENFSFKRAALMAIVFVFLYASSDEFHQIFIPGREARIRDVMIDTSGGAIALIVLKIFQKR